MLLLIWVDRERSDQILVDIELGDVSVATMFKRGNASSHIKKKVPQVDDFDLYHQSI